MGELFEKYNNVVSVVLVVGVCLNILLSAVSSILEKIKDLTTTDADNKALDIVNKLAGYLKQVVDFIGSNTKHK